MYDIIASVIAIVTNNRPTYLDYTQNEILKTLGANYTSDEFGSLYTMRCWKLVNFVHQEKLDELRNHVSRVIWTIRVLCFFIPYLILNTIFWSNISYTEMFSFAFLYTLIIATICFAFSFCYDFFFLWTEKEFIDKLEVFDTAEMMQRSEDIKRRENELRNERIRRDQEMRDKYL